MTTTGQARFRQPVFEKSSRVDFSNRLGIIHPALGGALWPIRIGTPSRAGDDGLVGQIGGDTIKGGDESKDYIDEKDFTETSVI